MAAPSNASDFAEAWKGRPRRFGLDPYRWPPMAGPGDKVSVDLDAEIVQRTRAALGADAESDLAVVERALNAYLLGRLLDTSQAASGLSDHEAERLSQEELHAARRDRGAV